MRKAVFFSLCAVLSVCLPQTTNTQFHGRVRQPTQPVDKPKRDFNGPKKRDSTSTILEALDVGSGVTSSTPSTLDLFGGVLTGVSADHAYVRTPVLQGFVHSGDAGELDFELSVAKVVGPKDTIKGVSREDFQRRVSALVGLINNGGAATARMVWSGAGNFLGGAFLGASSLELGILEKSNPTGSTQREAMSSTVEGRLGWNVYTDATKKKIIAGFDIGARGGLHYLGGDKIADGMTTSMPHFVQLIAQLHQGEKILFGVVYTTGMQKELRRYVPKVQLTLGSGIP